ncbi:MAG: hypothetical protein GF353_11545 [Candidatus Lokiarchaeota archaeon]|nr:hypothetical protein [Candidatus Lokiarchaeota archaeon]
MDHQKNIKSIFKINDYITLRLEKGKTHIYVKNELFITCLYLLLNVPREKNERVDNIDSIDEAAEILSHSMEWARMGHTGITAQEEFVGHCSNLQAWTDHGYDTRILHRNLAFPLLAKLTEVGDPQAKRVFKEEIAKRFLSCYPSVVLYLLEMHYLNYLNDEEADLVIKTLEKKLNGLKSNRQSRQLDLIFNDIGLFYLERKQFKKAHRFITTAIQIKPKELRYWNNLSSIYRSRGFFSEEFKLEGIVMEIKILKISSNEWSTLNHLVKELEIKQIDNFALLKVKLKQLSQKSLLVTRKKGKNLAWKLRSATRFEMYLTNVLKDLQDDYIKNIVP